MPTYSTFVHIPVSAHDAFAWHERPGALQRLIQPGSGVRLLSTQGTIHNGDRVTLSVPMPIVGVRLAWHALHRDYVADDSFCDVQERGPFRQWVHQHHFRNDPSGGDDSRGCRMEDHIDYQLPGGAVGQRLLGSLVEQRLHRLFAFRQRRTVQDLVRHQHFAAHGGVPSTFIVSGSTGLVGSALCPFLTAGGHRVRRLVRRAIIKGTDEIAWNPDQSPPEIQVLAGCDAVIHLAGSNVAAQRWDERERQRIITSRVGPTQRLCAALARMKTPPRVLIVASGIGYYGDRGDEVLDEQSPSGQGFLAGVCREWEDATRPAVEAGIRVVNLRTGMVLSPDAGALAKMLPIFNLGLGGVVGTGRQWMSWITLDDLIGAIYHIITAPRLQGAVNACSAKPVTNAEFVMRLAGALNRPAMMPVPRSVINRLLGDMGREMLLSSARVMPSALNADGFTFLSGDLESALQTLF